MRRRPDGRVVCKAGAARPQQVSAGPYASGPVAGGLVSVPVTGIGIRDALRQLGLALGRFAGTLGVTGGTLCEGRGGVHWVGPGSLREELAASPNDDGESGSADQPGQYRCHQVHDDRREPDHKACRPRGPGRSPLPSSL
ncbi:hypothetical protein GCM10010448_24690 [Streptomyces glomeratus]|uniref:Uncharacterized protein n=1 Tax=Streptomyces glomeratus TaxID=284452 RepID=A0ABP6LEF2_9ACTN